MLFPEIIAKNRGDNCYFGYRSAAPGGPLPPLPVLYAPDTLDETLPRMLVNNGYSGRQMEKRLVENIAYLWLWHIIIESTLQ